MDFEDDDDYFDAREARQKCLVSWLEVFDDSLPLGLGVEKLLREILYFPDSLSSQYKILATYFLANSRCASNAGYILHYGKSGTGKSQFLKLISSVFGIPTLLANSTGVGIRNHLKQVKYWIDEEGNPILTKSGKEKEKDGYFLLVDNLSISSLTNNETLYQLLLGGYDISTSKISIGGKNGKNIEFNAFGFKVLSSVDAIHLYSEFSELATRLLVIQHEYPPDGHTPKLRVDSVNWLGMKFCYENNWRKENILKHGVIYSSLNVQENLSLWEESNLSSRQWQIALELITTGLLFELWEDSGEAINCFIEFFQLGKENAEKADSSFKLLCKEFISQMVGYRIELLLEKGELEKAKAVTLNPQKLKDYLRTCADEGRLDDIPTPARVSKVMGSIGWKQGRDGAWIQI